MSETLANQIAAGEVIERPAAVVKELVENALDAGARRIEVELQDGGQRLVRVRDDGSGMGRDDARLALLRHATSKLASKDDLFNIATYGFRGEALPSIAAVSRFTLLTCEAGAPFGTRIEVEGGNVLSEEDAGAPPGTTVTVRDLFFNVPARRKFLKRASTEQAHAVEAVLRLAVPRADVSLSLREGARTLLQVSAGASLEERAAEALGPEVRGALIPFDGTVRGIRAHGLAASPDVTQSSARAVWLFVNGRAIRDRQLTHAVLRAYGEVVPHGRYPAALVFLEVPPAEVDVNVHPAKAEVRLADGRAAYEAILRGMRAVLAPGAWLHLGGGAAGLQATRTYTLGESRSDVAGPAERESGGDVAGPAGRAPGALGDEELIRIPSERAAAGAGPFPGAPRGDLAAGAGADAGKAYPVAAGGAEEHSARVAEALARYGERARWQDAPKRWGAEPLHAGAAGWSGGDASRERPADDAEGFRDLERGRAGGEARAPGAPVAPQPELIAPRPWFAGLRYLGQLHRTYLVCEGPRGLVLIDQHAAHERMNYQRLRRAAAERGAAVQPLLVPRVVKLSAAALARLSDAQEALAAAGLEVDAYGGNAVAVKALPAPLSSLGDRGLAALLGDLAEELSAHGAGESLDRLRDALLARAACHASVRAHDALAPGEAQALLDALDGTDYGARCAHGRPVVAELGTPEIEKRFGRDYESHAHAAPPEAI